MDLLSHYCYGLKVVYLLSDPAVERQESVAYEYGGAYVGQPAGEFDDQLVGVGYAVGHRVVVEDGFEIRQELVGGVSRDLGKNYDRKGIQPDRSLADELSYIDDPGQIQEAVEIIEEKGYDAVIYDDRTAADWADYLIDLAGESLTLRDKEYLENVRAFWSYSQ